MGDNEQLLYDVGKQESLVSARSQLRTQGWAVVSDVLTKEEISSVLSRLWKAKETASVMGEATYIPRLDPNESNVRIYYLLERDEVFRDLILHPLAVDIVRSVLGDDFLISNFTANIARPGSGSMGLHSDQSIVVPEPWLDVWALNVIWCLTDVYGDNGATLYIPGSNKFQTRRDVPANADHLLQPFQATAGSIILMDGRVWHTSGANITKDQDRTLLFAYYTKAFLRQQVNWTAKMSKDLQETLSEEMKARLGLNVEANISRTGDIGYNYLNKQFPKAR